MTKTETVKLLTLISIAYPQKFVYPKETKEETKLFTATWFSFLKDYDHNIVTAAFKKVAVNQPTWPPTIGEILQGVRKITRKEEDYLTAAEAWRLAREAALKYGHYHEKEGMLTLPSRVRETVKCIGRLETINRAEDDSYLMNTFMKVYKEFKARDEEMNVLPPTIKIEIEEIADSFSKQPPVESEEDRRAREEIEKKKQAEEKRVMEFYREHKELYEKK